MKIHYQWEIGDKVKLPFDETGTIVGIKSLIWGFNLIVRIRKSTLNKTNQRLQFRHRDLLPDND